MSENVRQRQKMTQRLRYALEHEQLQVWYQPIMNVHNGQTVAVEALCRWNDPEFGQVSPEDFIHVAEETSLIYELGDFVMRRACCDLKDWLVSNNTRMTVNLSPKQLKDQELIKRVETALQQNTLAPQHLCFEVTESLFLWDLEEAKKRLDQLSGLGVGIALDDFGTGFSNLGQLRRLPINYLKIDRSFVQDIDTDERALALVKAILAVTKCMGMYAVAEGVETLSQSEMIKSIGGKLVQGYYFAKPMPLDEFLSFAKK